MANEANKPVFLRTVKRDPVAEQAGADPKSAQKTGIIFEGVAEMSCPHCKAAVSLANSEPLSNLLCPGCGGKIMSPARLGGFFLYGHIGEGEMGAIYRATDESLHRDVAVKLVRGCRADDPDSRERLHREACAAGKLNHPRVAQVYALNFSNGHPYLVMELVDGEDFSQKLEREGRIDERTVLRMALDVADGLSALNREGLVHGDIKPGNIVLDRDGNAKLVDFGLSGMTRRDGQGSLVGTPHYIAPELLWGAEDTHRSDLYSLGATLYHLLSGRIPLQGATPLEVLKKARLFQKAEPLGKLAPQVSQLTQRLVMRMLEPYPEKRQDNSDVVAAEIREALSKLDSRAADKRGRSGAGGRLAERLGLPRGGRESDPRPGGRRLVTAILGVVAVIELAVAVKENSFVQLFDWLRLDVATYVRKSVASAVSKPKPEPTADQPKAEAAVPVQAETGAVTSEVEVVAVSPAPTEAAVPVPDVFTTEANLVWQSLNLGESSQRGSTMQMDGALIVQGAGEDMWKGIDRCRFVWTKVAGNFEFSAQVKVIADNNKLAVSGLLIKGENPSLGPGLLFGFLGGGELLLQNRQPGGKTTLIRRSEKPVRLPTYLKICRRGKRFDASVSADGREWDLFGSGDVELAPASAVGFAVSAQDAGALATAKFANIRLLTPGQPGAAKPSSPPEAVKKPAAVRDARRK